MSRHEPRGNRGLPGLRRIRRARGLTQAQVAKQAGVCAYQISRYKTGLDNPSLDVLDRLLAALECSYEELRSAALADAGNAQKAARSPGA